MLCFGMFIYSTIVSKSDSSSLQWVFFPMNSLRMTALNKRSVRALLYFSPIEYYERFRPASFSHRYLRRRSRLHFLFVGSMHHIRITVAQVAILKPLNVVEDKGESVVHVSVVAIIVASSSR